MVKRYDKVINERLLNIKIYKIRTKLFVVIINENIHHKEKENINDSIVKEESVNVF